MQRVDFVYDGDTLRLNDGSKVRLAGVNTPELDHQGGADEPFSRQARALLQRLVRASGGRVRVMLARDGEDHYGRLVAHLYDRNGASMQQQLLQSGLALAYVQPPNLGNMGCYFAAEREARRSGLALWANLPLHPADLERGFAGYALVRSRIQRVRNTRRSLWIELEGGLSLRIAASDLSLFSALDFKNSVGSELEARGYIRPHRGRLRMRIRHPSSLNLM